ncbi:DUF4304 domain-containing protein [Flavobacterium aquidurense]|uniref:DUF4304 domain-containing protein n=1 Tax=Flavobacterium aquidurense TaxID=362413 RepID=UPI00371E03BC
MSTERNQMIISLKKLFIPELRKLNFKGSFPHFRRIENDITNLITFQFDRYGGGFVIELANYKGKEYVTSWGEITELKKLTAHHLNQRKRIYPDSENEDNGKGSWFRYDKKTFLNFGNIYEKIAKKAIEKIPLMEKYWSEVK